MAAEACLIHGVDVETFIRCHTDPLDFCIHDKAPRSNRIVSVCDGVETELQNINRYYVSNGGVELVKIAPPVKGAKVGTWKRKAGVSDAEYEDVVRSLQLRADNLDAIGGVPGKDGITHEGVLHPWDDDCVLWDERIHTKAKSKHTERRTSFAKGLQVTVCNTMDDFDMSTINYDYYIAEARKLVDPLL